MKIFFNNSQKAVTIKEKMTNCIILRTIPQKRLIECKSNSENRIRYSQYNMTKD